MKVTVVIVTCMVAVALVLGFIADSHPIPARFPIRMVAVDPDWYSTLPADPEQATQQYLQRVPAEARIRGDEYRFFQEAQQVAGLVVLLISAIVILRGGLAESMRRLAERLTQHIILQDALTGLQLLILLMLIALPVDTYGEFLRPRAAGLSTLTYSQWLVEHLGRWGIDSIFSLVGIVAIMALLRLRPKSWAIWAGGIYAALSALYTLASPLYIEPLFNHYSPLETGPQKEFILSLARANGVPISDVFVRDASKQSSLLNANVTGFAGVARVTLDDNTLLNTPQPEVAFVMAHEIGHYVLDHVGLQIVDFSLVMLAGFLLIARITDRITSRLVAAGEHFQRRAVTLPVLWILYTLYGYISLPILNSIVREQEYQADLYGLNASQQPFGLSEFMIRDSDAYRLDPNSIEEMVFYSHPSARNRIFAAMRWRAEHFKVIEPAGTAP